MASPDTHQVTTSSQHALDMSSAALVADLPVGVTIQAPDTTFRTATAPHGACMGVPEGVLLGHGLRNGGWDITHEDGSPYEVEDLPACRVLATGEPVREMVLGNRDPVGGGRRWLIVNASPCGRRWRAHRRRARPSATSPPDTRRRTKRGRQREELAASTTPRWS